MARLAGKVAVVTGAGSIGNGWGNGKACAVVYAREGAQVVLVDRNEEVVAQTSDFIEQEGGSAISVVVDVSTELGVETYVEAALRHYGTIDILHNNVGIGIPRNFVEITESEWDLIYRVNLKSVFLGCRQVLPIMRSRGGGSIINISSIASHRWTGTSLAAYASSKAAINQLTQAIAIEYAKERIRCNAVVLGFIDTPTVFAGLSAGATEAERQLLAAQRDAACPMGRMGTVWEVASACVFLASDEASYVTGTELVVDGGLSATVPAG
jgi:NAD(P)-dependent dehydrogenase (short-subunit alcohol dehydrogenase family)